MKKPTTNRTVDVSSIEICRDSTNDQNAAKLKYTSGALVGLDGQSAIQIESNQLTGVTSVQGWEKRRGVSDVDLSCHASTLCGPATNSIADDIDMVMVRGVMDYNDVVFRRLAFQTLEGNITVASYL